jgi:hypothetical protein
MGTFVEPLTQYVHSLAVAILLGKVLLLSFVVAPILAKNLERDAFAKVVRQLFPVYYVLGMMAAAMGLLSVAVLVVSRGFTWVFGVAAGMWLLILAAESYCRSPLTLQSNLLRDRLKEQEQLGTVDSQLQAAWNRLHQRSICLNSLVLIGGLVLLGFTGQIYLP